jgi:hypothetical protein
MEEASRGALAAERVEGRLAAAADLHHGGAARVEGAAGGTVARVRDAARQRRELAARHAAAQAGQGGEEPLRVGVGRAGEQVATGACSTIWPA